VALEQGRDGLVAYDSAHVTRWSPSWWCAPATPCRTIPRASRKSGASS